MPKDERHEIRGCGDTLCIFGQPKGMATNGGCRCLMGLPWGERVRVERNIREMRERLVMAESSD